MVHADTDLEDAFVQMVYLTRRRPPQKLERFVLFEKLASVELVNSFHQIRRRGFITRRGEICCL